MGATETRTVSIVGEAVNEVDTERLADHIATLKAQKTTLQSAVEQPIDVGECGGSTINKIEELANLFQQVQDTIENLLDKTIQYLENRKLSVDEKENTSTATVEQISK